MATVPVPHTFVAGDNATSAVMQTLTDAILYLLGSTTSTGSRRPFAQMRQTVAQSVTTSAVWQAVTFDAEDVDYDNGHSTITNTDRYTAGTTGWHWVAGSTIFAANVTGSRGCRYTVNGTALNAAETVIPAVTSGGISSAVPGKGLLVFLNAADILRVEAFQNSTAALNTAAAGSQGCHLAVELRSN